MDPYLLPSKKPDDQASICFYFFYPSYKYMLVNAGKFDSLIS